MAKQKKQAKAKAANSKKPPEPKDLSKFIAIGKKAIRGGFSKIDAAREVYHAMKGEKRKHIVAAMMEGCDLSKAAAGTYYYAIQTKAQKKK